MKIKIFLVFLFLLILVQNVQADCNVSSRYIYSITQQLTGSADTNDFAYVGFDTFSHYRFKYYDGETYEYIKILGLNNVLRAQYYDSIHNVNVWKYSFSGQVTFKDAQDNLIGNGWFSVYENTLEIFISSLDYSFLNDGEFIYIYLNPQNYSGLNYLGNIQYAYIRNDANHEWSNPISNINRDDIDKYDFGVKTTGFSVHYPNWGSSYHAPTYYEAFYTTSGSGVVAGANIIYLIIQVHKETYVDYTYLNYTNFYHLELNSDKVKYYKVYNSLNILVYNSTFAELSTSFNTTYPLKNILINDSNNDYLTTINLPDCGYENTFDNLGVGLYGNVYYQSGDNSQHFRMTVYNSTTNDFVTSQEFTNGYYELNVINEGNYTVKIYDYLFNETFTFYNITFTSPSSEYNFELPKAVHKIKFDIKKQVVFNYQSTGCWVKINDSNGVVYQDNSFYDGEIIYLLQGNYTLYAYSCNILGICNRDNPVVTMNLTLSNNPPYEHIITIRFGILTESVTINNVTYSKFDLLVVNQNNEPIQGLNIKIFSTDTDFRKYYQTNNYGRIEDYLPDGHYYTVKAYVDKEWNTKKQETFYMYGNKTLFWQIPLTTNEQNQLNESYNQSIGLSSTPESNNNDISENAKNLTFGFIQGLFSTKIGIALMVITVVASFVYIEGKESKFALMIVVILSLYFTYIEWLPAYITLILAMFGIGLMSDKIRNIIIGNRKGE